MRLANSDALPFDFGAYARALREFVGDLEKKNRLQGHLEMAPLMLVIDNFERQGTELNSVVRRRLANGNADARMLESLNQAQM